MSRLVVVLSGFPRRSETFALGELTALAESGVLHAIFATKSGDGLAPHEDAARLSDWVTPLAPGDEHAQARQVVSALGGYTPLGIHGYFAHHPARVAELAASALGVRFSFSAHAKDARKVTPDDLRARASRAAAVITCNLDTQRELDRVGAPARLVPHGVNLNRFVSAPWRHRSPLRLLAVGRLVQKKGFHVLLEALALVHAPWTLRVVGEGPERASLECLARKLGVASRLDWRGPASHSELPALYHAAHVVVVPSIVDEAGDRDGLPNVVLEAMASARLVVATRVGAIATAISDGRTGRLVEPNDPVGLAAALEGVARAEGTAMASMAARGRWLVEERFDLRRCAGTFVETLTGCYA